MRQSIARVFGGLNSMGVFRNFANSERMKGGAMYPLAPPGYRPILNFLLPTDWRQINTLDSSVTTQGWK